MKVSPRHKLAKLLEEDPRYAPAAYEFIFDSLAYAHERMGLGQTAEGEDRHISGQELCEAARRLALEQFGLMARAVFEGWGLRETGDFGEIVYNLIRVEEMKKTENDRREDFDNVFDFETGLLEGYEIEPPEDP